MQDRGANTQNMAEHNPVGSFQNKSMTERRIQTIEGQIKPLTGASEARMSAKLLTTSCLFSWLIIHAANILNLRAKGKDGKVLFQEPKGLRMYAELMEFGERVLCQPLK